MGRRLTLPGPMGCCEFARIIQLLERSREVWAARRALVLPHQEGALCSYRGSAVYHSARNNFERFRWFLELFSRFEFDLRRCEFFLERFEFLVCSKFDHTQCGRTCACAVACLYPHNFISNVVASVTIHDDMYIYIYIYI